MKLSLLSYAIAVAAASGAAQSAFAVDLCTGETAITVSQSIEGTSCSLDTSGARLTVTEDGGIDQGVNVSVANAGVTNDGTISGTAYQSLSSSGNVTAIAYAAGINVDGNLGATLSNSGTISAGANAFAFTSSSSATAQAYATADGINVQGESLAAISNSGTITANAYAYANGSSGDSAYARARGIKVEGDLSAGLTNSGTITINANVNASSGDAAYAQGILGNNIKSRLVNEGVISVTAGGYDGTASGIDVANVSATVLNSGEIYATFNGRYGQANGFEADAIATLGVFQNTGVIQANAYGSSADADGVSVNDISGRLVNSGDITASVGYGSGSGSGSGSGFGSSSGAARGIVAELIDGSGVLKNEADATIRASGYGYYVDATAVWVSSVEGTLNNAGDIEASISGRGTATGLSFFDAVGTILNSGNISASVNGSGSVYATAVDGALLSGSLTNSGNIHAMADGYYASATGISGDWFVGNLTNAADGTISAEADGFNADARAIVVDDLAASLVNSGGIEAFADGYQAYSRAVVADESFTGSVSNRQGGTITAEAYGSNFADAVAVSFEQSSTGGTPDIFAALVAEGSLNGSLVNNGVIRAGAYASDNAYAKGVSVMGDFAGTLNNSGDIEAEAYGDNYANAVGVLLGNGNSGSMTRGLISPMSSTVISGKMNNSGDVMAYASASRAYAYGVQVQAQLEGSIANTGTIEASANGADSSNSSYYARARGLALEGGVAGSVSNSGSISAYAEGDYADAKAVLVAALEGEFVNGGDIYASADGFAARSYGIDADVGASGLLTNNADITADAYTSGFSSGEAVGVRLEQYSSSTGPVMPAFAMVAESMTSFVNNGAVRASSSAYYATAVSLHVLDSFDNDLVNAGDLTAYAEGFGANAYGVLASSSLNGTLENKGNITAFASAYNGGAYGVYVQTLYGTIDNSGTIAADGDFSYSGISGPVVNALRVNEGSGQVINSGLIDGGIYLDGSVSLSNSGTIVLGKGRVASVNGDYEQLAGGKLVFNVTSTSQYSTFGNGGTADFTAGNHVHVQVDPENTLVTGDALASIVSSSNLLLPESGAFEVTDSSVFWTFEQEVVGNELNLTATELSTEQALAGSGLSGSQVALVDAVMGDLNGGTYSSLALALFNAPTAQAAADVVEEAGPLLPGAPGNAARAASLGASNAISARLNARRGASSGDAFQDNSVWIKPFLGKAEQDAVGTLNGYDVDNSGFVIGVDGDISDSLRVGLAVASSQGDVESNNSGIDLSSTHVALYGTYALSDTAALDMDVTRVATGYDSTRQVGFASSTARANFDGSQFGLGLALSKRVAMGEKSSFEPSVAVRYNRVSIDGYSETGAGAFNLTVDDVREDSLLWSAKGSFEFGVGKGAILANAGIGYDTLDATGVSATFAGAGPTFTSTGAKPDSTVLMGGLGYRYVTAKSLEIDAMFDVESRGDFQAQTASVKFKLPF